jgi:putative membrane protein
MEGPKNMSPPSLRQLAKEKNQMVIPIFIIILFHLVGLIGFLVPGLTPVFLRIVPWHLLLMLMVIIFSHKNCDDKFLLFVLCLFISGYGIEWIGIHKYWLFGNYYYGQTLGIQLSGVPLAIGINWFLLIYSAGVLMQRSRLKSMLLRIITGALLLVLLDTLIEPVATRFDYWHWTSDIIPFKNYICWFLVSCFMLLVFELFDFKKQSTVAAVFLITQFVFFSILNGLHLLIAGIQLIK